jgi:hypothetical protein
MAQLIIIDIKSSTDRGSKTKAREEQCSATTMAHVNQMLGECHNLPLLFPNDPEHHNVSDNPETINNDLVNCIKQVMGSSCAKPLPPEFKFKMMGEAVKHNLAV